MIPAAAALAARQAVPEITKLLDTPFIGVKRSVTKRTKTKTKTVETAFQMRGWELAIIGGIALVAFGGVALSELWKGRGWDADTAPKPGPNATSADWNNYYIERMKRGFLGWLP